MNSPHNVDTGWSLEQQSRLLRKWLSATLNKILDHEIRRAYHSGLCHKARAVFEMLLIA